MAFERFSQLVSAGWTRLRCISLRRNVMKRTALALSLVWIALSLAVPTAEMQQANRQSSSMIAVKAGRLLDVKRGVVSENQTILIENGRIKSIGSEVAIPNGVKLID